MTTDRTKLLSVRLNQDEWDRLEAAAKARGITRGEATREALDCGLPMVEQMMMVDLVGMSQTLERMQVLLDVIVKQEYPLIAERLGRFAENPLEQFHGYG